jgi:hypothetical protein
MIRQAAPVVPCRVCRRPTRAPDGVCDRHRLAQGAGLAAPSSAPQAARRQPKRWYCGMCERQFTRGGDCPLCGFALERWQ